MRLLWKKAHRNIEVNRSDGKPKISEPVVEKRFGVSHYLIRLTMATSAGRCLTAFE